MPCNCDDGKIKKIIGLKTKTPLNPHGVLNVVSIDTYKKYCKRYKITLTKNGVYRDIQEIKALIRDYEWKNRVGLKDGLYY